MFFLFFFLREDWISVVGKGGRRRPAVQPLKAGQSDIFEGKENEVL